jgi:hypothetical protein
MSSTYTAIKPSAASTRALFSGNSGGTPWCDRHHTHRCGPAVDRTEALARLRYWSVTRFAPNRDEAKTGGPRRTERADPGRRQWTRDARCSIAEPARRSRRAAKERLNAMIFPQQHNLVGPPGSLDGEGAGDHDQPYRFGWRPRANVPYPFNTRQYARLLVLRGRLHDGCRGWAWPVQSSRRLRRAGLARLRRPQPAGRSGHLSRGRRCHRARHHATDPLPQLRDGPPLHPRRGALPHLRKNVCQVWLGGRLGRRQR